MKLSHKRHLLVASGFAGTVVLTLLVAWLVGLYPPRESRCQAECAAKGQRGRLEYVYSAAQTAGMKGRGPQECKCSCQ